MSYHIPVLAAESINGLDLKPDSVVVDATFGGGGHSRLILERIPNGRLYAFDQDEEAEKNLIDDSRFFFIRHNYRYMRNFLHYYGVTYVDAVLADLGVSSHHFDEAGRGFSYRYEGRLDMRMNRLSPVDACKVINEYEVPALEKIFREYGEINNAARLAATIGEARTEKQILTTSDLRAVISRLIPKAIEMKYLSQVFQAVRIEVNDELASLTEFLQSALELLRPGGRMAVITYHSLESRIAKNFFRSGNISGEIEKDFYGNVTSPFRLVNKKVIIPAEAEVNLNSRARSAKLRIVEKV
jgi:16S rRNA (cytosine1402-N4)-methyltransferase